MNYIAIAGGILFAIVCGISAYMYYNNYKKEKKNQTYLENNEFLKKDNSVNGELIFFYTTWCPYCKDAKTTWNNIKKSGQFAKYNLNFVMIDCENQEQNSIVNEFKITEYPSYVLSMNGKKYVYDANLDATTLDKFLTAVYKKQ